MRILFEETNDFERHNYHSEGLFIAEAFRLLRATELKEVSRQGSCITALLSYPRSNAYHEIARQLGNIPWIVYADTAEFRAEELTRFFLCYPPRLLIGSAELLEQAKTLPKQCFLQLEAVLSVGGKVEFPGARSYRWKVKLTRQGIESHVD